MLGGFAQKPLSKTQNVNSKAFKSLNLETEIYEGAQEEGGDVDTVDELCDVRSEESRKRVPNDSKRIENKSIHSDLQTKMIKNKEF